MLSCHQSPQAHLFDTICYTGRVPIAVRGPWAVSWLAVPSGRLVMCNPHLSLCFNRIGTG